MDIINPGIKFTAQLDKVNKNNYDSIGIHHIQAKTATVYDIHKWHLERTWKGIGYGWYVRKDGTIYAGRGFNLNAAVDQNNGHIVSVAFEGDYNVEAIMPDIQFNSGIDLINWIKPQLPNLKMIDGHKAWNQTECPGLYFPLQEMLAGKKRGLLTWKEILQKAASDPDTWENSINVAVAAAKADGNLGSLEVFQWLPTLIEKIYNSK